MRTPSRVKATMAFSGLPIRVYLDQNAWIQLARHHYGKSNSRSDLSPVLTCVQQHAQARTASFPLSASHYFEIFKRGDPAARRRLGHFMASIAGADRIRDATQLLVDEIHTSLSYHYGLAHPPPPQPFGQGLGHLFPEFTYDTPVLAAAIGAWGRQAIEAVVERDMLMGPSFQLPDHGIARPDNEISQRHLSFELRTQDQLRGATDKALARRVVLAQEALDIMEPMMTFLADHHVDSAPYRTADGLTRTLLSLPAKGAITRMRISAHQNPNFRWAIGDLHDLVALGTAAGYCDIVVCEKQWGSILQRHQKHLQATILTRLRELPEILIRHGQA